MPEPDESPIEITYTCSLGQNCHSGTLLKRNNIKLCSYPFDWIFSKCDNIIHCIEDNFKIFLDKSYYNALGDNCCEHTYYYEKGCGTNMFNHFNPLDNENHYNYYVRCVDRFKCLLQKEEHKLFIRIFINTRFEEQENIKNQVIDFNHKFSKYTHNYTLLVIVNLPTVKQEHEFIYVDNIHFLVLKTLSHSSGIKFDNDDDNMYLDNILKSKYRFNLKALEKIKN